MSVLLPSTQAILRDALRMGTQKRSSEEQLTKDAYVAESIRLFARKPHVAWCRCAACKARELEAEAKKLAEQLAGTEAAE